MVILCKEQFSDVSDKYSQYYNLFPNILLSDFQKWALKAIIDGDNVLITAHTGSGKTLPAEFAIKYFTDRKKKVIYTSPIKALSNQKLYDMRRKFPKISFGILTGDCKDNPEADVLIMTTEILRNTLFAKHLMNDINNTNISSTLNFEINFQNELGAVIFDEVHYINDAERGAVWEQSILLLPPQVQLIMLSATIDKPEKFAGWIEMEKQKQAELSSQSIKKMYLASTYERVVPLTHYMWLSIHNKTFHNANKTPYESKMMAIHHKPQVIATSSGIFDEKNYYKINDILDYMSKNKTYVKRPFVLDDLIKYLKENDMLPAICFIFSRKHVEIAAKELSFGLFEKNSGIPPVIERECMKILMAKLPNYLEYINLPEYLEIVSLLQKGIAIHHAGIMPVLREMVELMFEKGFIKLLFATETFAVGINMPTKSVIFTGLTKYNGSEMRLLYPHEYTQMAGRAGRRGIDLVGHVIHCNNLFDMPTSTEYKNMLTGPAQSLKSKFKISFSLALNMFSSKQDPIKVLQQFVDKSLLSSDIKTEITFYDNKSIELSDKLLEKQYQLSIKRTPECILREYKEKKQLFNISTNSTKKKLKIDLTDIETEYKFLLQDLLCLDSFDLLKNELSNNKEYSRNTSEYVQGLISQMLQVLVDNKFLINNTDKENVITQKGLIATFLQEVHPLVMADLYELSNGFSELNATELASLFSCFASVNVSDEIKCIRPKCNNYKLNTLTFNMNELFEKYYNIECKAQLNSGSNYDIQFDLQLYILDWCNSNSELECKQIIADIKKDKDIFLGDFVKAVLKINNIATEFEKVCEIVGNIELLEKLKKISSLTLKYVVTNQSLYL
jgi:superfamily II RNA helicase